VAPDRSLGEIEALARRAARGAGLPWGLADEAAGAAAWLESHGRPGAGLLAVLLARNDCLPYAALAPETDGPFWRAPGGRLCPVISGAALSDRAARLAEGRLRLGPVSCPLLLAPFAAQAARETGAGLQLDWAGARLTVHPDGLRAEGEAVAAAEARAVALAPCAAPPAAAPPPPARRRAAPSAEALETLTRLAARLLAPAAQGGRAGAGAGRIDND
jgi:hypothetical protein